MFLQQNFIISQNKTSKQEKSVNHVTFDNRANFEQKAGRHKEGQQTQSTFEILCIYTHHIRLQEFNWRHKTKHYESDRTLHELHRTHIL